ncbi:glycoside hydrolase superfamily [Aspergillus avenaceus]|uniref:chitinase n=1 Tax=Aspergillus avenaceus TaxID=36643 RepID=A0A5N6TGR1_ASPAV|nr:glycoside hydrolase superfamily [Aspergillus avenaceus]
MGFNKYLAVISAASALFPQAYAFDPQGKSNVAVYYGQGANQERLSHFCQQTSLDVINIGFVNEFPDQSSVNWPGSNFGNQCDGQTYVIGGVETKFLTNCRQIMEDIPLCQEAGKKVLLSLGGASPDNQKILSTDSAVAFADFLWSAFGPVDDSWLEWGGPRPFGNVSVDGFDFDIEHNGGFGYATMVNRFRGHFSENPDRKFYISGSPQCHIPDEQLGSAIATSAFDFVWVQFYNNDDCSARNFVSGTGFNFDKWVNIVKLGNPAAKLFVGLPGSESAALPGYYLTPSEVEPLVSKYMKLYPDTFGGIMVWEATQSDRNQINGTSYAGNMKRILTELDPSLPIPKPSPSSSTLITSSTPVHSSTPLASSTPISSSTPVQSSTLVALSTPVHSSTPTSSSTTVQSSTPVTSSTPISSSTPVQSSTPVGSSTPLASSTLIHSSTHHGSSTPLASSTPVQSSTLVASSSPLVSNTPIRSSTPVGSSTTQLSSSAASSSRVASSTFVRPTSSISSGISSSIPAISGTPSGSSTPVISSISSRSHTRPVSSPSSSLPIIPGTSSVGTPIGWNSTAVLVTPSTSLVVTETVWPTPSKTLTSLSPPVTSESSGSSSSVAGSESQPLTSETSYSARTSTFTNSAVSSATTPVSSSESLTRPRPAGESSSVQTHVSNGVTPSSYGQSITATGVATITPGVSAPSVTNISSTSEPTTVTTVIVTSYVDICPTGFTTVTTTYTTTYCPGTVSSSATATELPSGSGFETTAPAPPEGWTTTVTVCTHCAATPTTVTLTLPATITGAEPVTAPAVPTTAAPPIEGWVTTVSVCTDCAPTPTTITVTVPVIGTGSIPGFPTGTNTAGHPNNSAGQEGSANSKTANTATGPQRSAVPSSSGIVGTGGAQSSSTLFVRPSTSGSRVPVGPSGTQDNTSPVFTGAASQNAVLASGALALTVFALPAMLLI